MGRHNARRYFDLRKLYREQGDKKLLQEGLALLGSRHKLSAEDRERLTGHLQGSVKTILPEPRPLLTKASKLPGLDGQKMSKSYGNTIELREDPRSVTHKLRTMPTDPARVRRTDPGEPEK